MAKSPAKSTETSVPGGQPRPSVAHLLKQVSELESEIEGLHDAWLAQELYLIDGYIIVIQPGTDVPFIAFCPTLHANTQGNTFEGVLANLRDAIRVAREGREYLGHPIPPKDTEARCLD